MTALNSATTCKLCVANEVAWCVVQQTMLKCFTHIRRAFINLKAAKADLPLFVEKCKYTKLYYFPEHPVGVLVTFIIFLC